MIRDCFTCRHWKAMHYLNADGSVKEPETLVVRCSDGHIYGECRRYAPKREHANSDSTTYAATSGMAGRAYTNEIYATRWPETMHSDFCGEFEPRESEGEE